MPDIYLKRLHGADYRLRSFGKLREPALAEAPGEFPPQRPGPAFRPWKRSDRLFRRTEPPGAASSPGAFVRDRCRSAEADAARAACARSVDRPRWRDTPPPRARPARAGCPHRSRRPLRWRARWTEGASDARWTPFRGPGSPAPLLSRI